VLSPSRSVLEGTQNGRAFRRGNSSAPCLAQARHLCRCAARNAAGGDLLRVRDGGGVGERWRGDGRERLARGLGGSHRDSGTCRTELHSAVGAGNRAAVAVGTAPGSTGVRNAGYTVGRAAGPGVDPRSASRTARTTGGGERSLQSFSAARIATTERRSPFRGAASPLGAGSGHRGSGISGAECGGAQCRAHRGRHSS
jgi:hypothetical protein